MSSVKDFVIGYTDISNGTTELMCSSKQEALYDFSYIISKVLMEKENVYVGHSIEEINFLSEINISINKNIILECSNTSSDEIQALVYKYKTQKGYIYNKKLTILKYSFFVKKLRNTMDNETASLTETIDIPLPLSVEKSTSFDLVRIEPHLLKDKETLLIKDKPETKISLMDELTKKFEEGLKLNKISFDIEEKDFKTEFQKELYNRVKQRKCNKKRYMKKNH